jgi:hypothetical protein
MKAVHDVLILMARVRAREPAAVPDASTVEEAQMAGGVGHGTDCRRRVAGIADPVGLDAAEPGGGTSGWQIHLDHPDLLAEGAQKRLIELLRRDA